MNRDRLQSKKESAVSYPLRCSKLEEYLALVLFSSAVLQECVSCMCVHGGGGGRGAGEDSRTRGGGHPLDYAAIARCMTGHPSADNNVLNANNSFEHTLITLGHQEAFRYTATLILRHGYH